MGTANPDGYDRQWPGAFRDSHVGTVRGPFNIQAGNRAPASVVGKGSLYPIAFGAVGGCGGSISLLLSFRKRCPERTGQAKKGLPGY